VTRGQRMALIGAALIVAALAIVLLAGGDDEDTTPAETGTQPTLSQEPTASVPAPEPEPGGGTIRIVNGAPEGGVADITVNKDDRVRLKVESEDTSGEIHVHGYDLMENLEAGSSVTFSFDASIEGGFEVEIEDTKTQIAELTVEP
jgi:hypothetical protein